jgi:O-antigen/teichoic acid export membrane protein
MRASGQRATRPAARDRSELFVNTVASWTWSQGTLVVSILALPLLTHLLSADEFGLWTQLLSLSAAATVADLGMSLVFLRRITAGSDGGPAATLGSATAFYRASSAILAVVLLAACLIPGGLLTPYASHTSLPALGAVLVIAGMGINLLCQPYTLRLLALGRMDLERVFGAGPAIAGTLASILAAYWFGTAVAIAAGYAAVEVAFDAALVLVACRRWPRSRHAPAARHPLAWWGRLWYESTGVLAIDLVPLISLTIGITVVGYVAGPAAAAVYGLAGKVGSLVPRFFTPFSDSLFVSLCRAAAPTRGAVARLAGRLSMMTLAGGTAAAFVVVTAGPGGMRLVFGDGYGYGIWAVLGFVLTGTVRSMYRPFYRSIQAEDGIGSLRYWFAASMIAQIPLTIVAARQWSAAGAAVAALACAVVFEAAPVAGRLSAYHRPAGTGGRPVLEQAGAAVCAGCLVVLVAWARHRLGAGGIALAATCAGAAGLLTVHRMVRYLAAARLVRGPSVVPGPGSLVPDAGET